MMEITNTTFGLAGVDRSQAEKMVRDALDAEEKGDLSLALRRWKKAAELFHILKKGTRDPVGAAKLARQMHGCLNRAKALQGRQGSGERSSREDQSVEERGNSDVLAPFRYHSEVSFDDIAGYDDLKEDLYYQFSSLLAKPAAGRERPRCVRILMDGPPGVGKTHIAAACSSLFRGEFYSVSIDALKDKYHGGSEKAIAAVFDEAKRRAQDRFVFMFIDEIDGLVVDRSDASSSSADTGSVTTFLSCMDGLKDKGARGGTGCFILMVATNHPQRLDKAFKDRFREKIHVPLPDEYSRREILSALIQRLGIEIDSDVSLQELAKKTAGFSGRQLETLCSIAQKNADRDANQMRVKQAVADGNLSGMQLVNPVIGNRYFLEAIANERDAGS